MTESAEKSVVILHAGAIGDVVLGTLVPVEIKRARPELQVIYWTHESLIDMLRLCPAIDRFVVWDKKTPLWQQRGIVRGANAEVFVDLSASLRTRIISMVAGICTYRYRKQSPTSRPIVHAAENFRATVSPMVGTGSAQFPSFVVPDEERLLAKRECGIESGNTVALVPGVGELRSHRAWPAASWQALARKFLAEGRKVLLIGGRDDIETARAVEAGLDGAGLENRVGQLSLRQTAAALSECCLAISGDTGPSHIAVAVGTPVIGLLGPTYPERSGPYGNLDHCLNAGNQCQCHASKMCLVTGTPGPGQCMTTISVEQVYDCATPFCLENSRQ